MRNALKGVDRHAEVDYTIINYDDFINPAMRDCAAFFVIATYYSISTTHSSGFAHLEFGAFYFVVWFGLFTRPSTMKLSFSNRQIASILGETQTKARRWVKEFLPPDPDKGLRSGRTRRHSLNEVFSVYLGGHLVSKMDFSVLEAKTILKDLAVWMEREGLYPEKTSKYAPKDHGSENLGIARYDIHIMLTMIPLAFCYECRGLIREQRSRNGVVRSECVVDSFFGAGQPVQMSSVIEHVRILPISGLLHRFKSMLSFRHKPRQATTKDKGSRARENGDF